MQIHLSSCQCATIAIKYIGYMHIYVNMLTRNELEIRKTVQLIILKKF